MIILIDNYDSFTYNLVDYFASIGQEVKVFRNDAITIDQIQRYNPRALVLSPGPCSPNESGICIDVVKHLSSNYPILGVCLGHQVIGQVFGGKIIKAPIPMHGKISSINHNNHKIFDGIPSPFDVTRYHSLIISPENFPNQLEITSKTDDGIIMSVSHKNLNIHGVQFHPESITTTYGMKIIKNFVAMI